jgi:aspartate/methionine/tyrosine aminotransferase
MPDALTALNQSVEAASPALFSTLSPLGRRVIFPPDIPFQAAQARGKSFNATIGQITDGRGGAVRLPSLAAGLAGLPETSIDRALLYSPVEGIPELRHAWRERQRRCLTPEEAERVPSSLPLVTVGLTHGLCLAADLFGGEGRVVAVPSPFWGNYRQTFTTRTGAEVRTAPARVEGRFNAAAVPQALAGMPAGEPAVALLNQPSNPGGYSPTVGERARLGDALLAAAEQRPLVVVCDDAYAGLVYDDEIPRRSMFWELVGRHPNLIPVKVDGATKEVSFFGGRVGFVTFPFEPDSDIARALESKVKCLTRAALGSPVATSQMLLWNALRSETLEAEIEALRRRLGRRVAVLRQALAGCDRSLLRPLPFNSGCFALLELPEELGLEAETVRQHLLAEQDTGLISIAPRYLRIAHCSVAAEAIPELMRRIERGVGKLAGR